VTRIHTALLIAAFVATCYATISLLCGFDGDFIVSAIIAILTLAAAIWREHIEHQRAQAYFDKRYWDEDSRLPRAMPRLKELFAEPSMFEDDDLS
jgi:hypothetical protein